MTNKDRQRIRSLAQKQLEIANSSQNIRNVELWKRHACFKSERPPIHIEVGAIGQELIVPFMQCEDTAARAIERSIIQNFVNAETVGDDKPVPPYYQIGYQIWFHLFGYQISNEVLKDKNGVELGHKYGHVMNDLHEDFSMILHPSVYGADREATMRKKEELEELFGDILPVKLTMGSLYAAPTQKIVHLMSMEKMFCAMIDYPDEFKTLMKRIEDDYIEYFRFLEAEKLLLPTTSYEWLSHGSFCFSHEEPKNEPPLLSDVWGGMDSQETVGISPEMFNEFIYPYYKNISNLFGRLSYGCCEPVNTFWDDIKKLTNLRKVSISPWCDEDFMAQELRGKEIVYYRKPSPNYLGVGTKLDEEAFRKHIEKTVITAKGCHLEIAQRDLYTVNNDIPKVRRYVEIIREAIENHWVPA